jgi:tetratricopeptide (TPR) repeat protein
LHASAIYPQHPNRPRIDSLKNLLPTAQGTKRIDALNTLSEEYWLLPSSSVPDSVSQWAVPAYRESQKIIYAFGLAHSLIDLGIVELYKKNFLTAEKNFRQALRISESIHYTKGIAWSNVWLGQDLISQNKFQESVACYEKAEALLQTLMDYEGLGKTWAWLGVLYTATGDYDKALFYASRSLSLRKKMSDHLCVANSLNNMGYLYRSVGAYNDALDYYNQSRKYAADHSIDLRLAHWNFLLEGLGSLYRAMNLPDSSMVYLREAILVDPTNLMTHVSIGETLLTQNKFDSALGIFLPPIDHLRKENDQWDLVRVSLDAARAYMGKKEDAQSFPLVYESLFIAEASNLKPFRMADYQLLSKLYENTPDKKDSSLFFLKKYTALKDSVSNDRFMFMLSNYKKQEEFKKQQEIVATLNWENKQSVKKLGKETFYKWIYLAALLITVLSVVFIYRSLTLKRNNENLENQKKQSELKLKASELEMQALRAQINPHFIFNCLSSINRFIIKNETEAASDYLTKFSRLIRIVLTNSKSKFITLENELEMLRMYLDMERLRFKNSFAYNISFTNSINVDNLYIPPMLLQPFAENAIWHGLMNKESGGELTINFSEEDGFLICTITDNGIGRKAAGELKKKTSVLKKSMGIKITQERLSLLNANEDDQTFFEFEDPVDEDGNSLGTKVTLRIKAKDIMEIQTNEA